MFKKYRIYIEMTVPSCQSDFRLPLALAIDANVYLSYFYAFIEIGVSIKKYIDATSLNEYRKNAFSVFIAST